MKEILTHYDINEETLAILPAGSLHYQTIILESDQKLYVNKPSWALINHACLQNLSSYTGRREAISHQTGYNRKVPIPINHTKNIIAFPTLSPTHSNCAWIFYQHIQDFQPISQTKQTRITFKNGIQITLEVSYEVVEKQVQRTARCLLIGREL